MTSLGKLCPRSADPKHQCHDTIAGHHPVVGPVSTFAGRYPPKFVQAVLQFVPRFNEQEVLFMECDDVPAEQWKQVTEVCAAAHVQPSEREILATLAKLHRNLGHPPKADLVRLLKHGQASAAALELARHFSCSSCQSREKPKVPLPANTDRVCEFNKQIGLDAKHLDGNQIKR